MNGTVIVTFAALAGFAVAGTPAGLLAQQQPQQQQQQQQRPPAQQQRPPAQQQQQQRPPAQQPAQPQAQRPPATTPAPQQAVPSRPPVPLPPEGTQLVVFDSQWVLQTSQAGQAMRSQIERRRTQLQQEAAQQQEEFRKIADDLQKQRALLSPDAFAQRQREVETRAATAEQTLQSRLRGADESVREAQQRFIKEVNAILLEIFQEQKYALVVQKEALAISQSNLDISDEVVKRLNKKLATININFAQR